MSLLSNRIKNLQESATIAMSRKSRFLQREGVEVINLSIGQPDFNTPEYIKDAAKRALDENYTAYTPVAGYLDLREAIMKKFRRDNALVYEEDEVMVCSGAKHCLSNVILCLVDHGEEVIVPAPYWVSYVELVKLAGGTAKVIEAGIEQDYKLTAQQLQEALTQKTKMLIFNSPNNPSGSVYNYEEILEIVKVIEKHSNLYVISDEIYELINYSGEHISLASFESIKDRVITINGISKGFAMTGWRLGFIGAHKEIIKACIKLQSQHTSAPSSITQRAAITALKIDPKKSDELRYMQNTFLQRRNLMYEALKEIQGLKTNLPDGAFYHFPDISYFLGKSYENESIKSSEDLSLYLLDQARVATVPGEAFGSPNNLRLSYATSNDKIEKGIEAIKHALNKLS